MYLRSLSEVNLKNILPLYNKNIVVSLFHGSSTNLNDTAYHGRPDDEFRVLDLKRTTKREVRAKKKVFKAHIMPPRTEKMSFTQDWSNVWPGPRTFHPAVVPLPVRQGRNKLGPPPDKYANAELMKIPNFLHLTPPAMQKHCEALKKFCTPWPKGLETDEQCEKHFPIEVITSDYCHSSPTIRDPLARIVTVKFKLNRLNLDRISRDKYLRLVGDRHNAKTDEVTIVTDRCPLKKQNYDYAMYLMTALFHESWNVEAWEKEKSELDMEYYVWELNKSKDNTAALLKAVTGQEVEELPPEWKTKLDDYIGSVMELFNKGENDDTLKNYKKSTLNLLFNT